jgi:SAM-dependent methyltransferase
VTALATYARLRALPDPARSLGWASADTQAAHLSTLVSALPDRLDGLTVRDLGCGHGDAVPLVEARGGRYVGLDALPVDVARARWPGRAFVQRDALSGVLSPVDFTLMCGTLAYQSDLDARRLLDRAWSSSRVGVLFSVWTPEAGGPTWVRHWAGERRAVYAERPDLQTAYWRVRR